MLIFNVLNIFGKIKRRVNKLGWEIYKAPAVVCETDRGMGTHPKPGYVPNRNQEREINGMGTHPKFSGMGTHPKPGYVPNRCPQ